MLLYIFHIAHVVLWFLLMMLICCHIKISIPLSPQTSPLEEGNIKGSELQAVQRGRKLEADGNFFLSRERTLINIFQPSIKSHLPRISFWHYFDILISSVNQIILYLTIGFFFYPTIDFSFFIEAFWLLHGIFWARYSTDIHVLSF